MLRGEEGVGENVKEGYVFLYLRDTEPAYRLIILADGDAQDHGDFFCDYVRRNSGGNELW